MGVALLLAKAIGRLLLRPTDDTCAVVEPRGVLRCGLSKSVVLAARCPPTFFRISAPLLLPPPPPLAVAALKDLVLGYSHRDPPPSATSYFNSH
jgi:hypothetical protein